MLKARMGGGVLADPPNPPSCPLHVCRPEGEEEEEEEAYSDDEDVSWKVGAEGPRGGVRACVGLRPVLRVALALALAKADTRLHTLTSPCCPHGHLLLTLILSLLPSLPARLSRQVRRAAAKLLAAVASQYPDAVADIYARTSGELISRWGLSLTQSPWVRGRAGHSGLQQWV